MNKYQERARELRKAQTPTELMLWRKLRGKQIGTVKFRRQFTIEPYIVDFYRREAQLIIEIDGDVHADEKQVEYDKHRAGFLESKGFRVLRVTNDEIRGNLEGVLEKIHSLVMDPHLASPERGGK